MEKPPKKEPPKKIIHSNKKPQKENEKKPALKKKVKITAVALLIIVGILFSAQTFGLISIYSPPIQNDNFVGTWDKDDITWMKVNETPGLNMELLSEINGSSIPNKQLEFTEDGICKMESGKDTTYHLEPHNILVIGSDKNKDKYNYDFCGNQNQTLTLRYLISDSLVTISYNKKC